MRVCMKTIAILGATGSVGTQALDVARARGYRVDLISANRNIREAEAAAREFLPRYVCMTDETAAQDLRLRLSDTAIQVLSGAEGLSEGIARTEAQTVVHAILGAAGVRPTLDIIDAGKRLALANKESLVIAGDIVMARAGAMNTEILPVDSEHCAIFQSLRAGRHSEVRRLLLTASGGPFFGYSREALSRVSAADTLRHPTWRMGKKITVDSATLMNKGFEILEASHLFSVPTRDIEVVVHRESILHSAVEYIDNTVIGEFSLPDMRMCVQYAVDYPDRCVTGGECLDLTRLGQMTFFPPDREAFPLLDLAVRAGALGGGMGAVLNAADEVAVEAFLQGRLSFLGIADTVSATFEACLDHRHAQQLSQRQQADEAARAYARAYIETHRKDI